MKILHNHLGYRAAASAKRALLQASGPQAPAERFVLYEADERRVVFEGAWQSLGPVERWRDWHYWAADFGALTQPGRYIVAAVGTGLPLQSQPFAIQEALYDGQHVSDLLHYIKSQRCGGIFDAADRACPIFGSDGERMDVHGGWYDASGDASKYLSHLSYANFLNPQQTPQVVWNLIETRDRLAEPGVWMDDRLVDEALHGADFLHRLQRPDGAFCATVFDRWSKRTDERRICAYATQKGELLPGYQAAFRQGGGLAIAALARASTLPRDGAFTRAQYLAAAERGFAHLQQHNRRYLPDGQENIIDDYAALLAATELCAAGAGHGDAVRERSARLLARQHADGWFWADDARTRSFTHAAEAGLPFVALLRTLEACPDAVDAPALRAAVARGLQWELRITQTGAPNPFALPRQYVLAPGVAGTPGRVRFFMPHHNDSGYWWQGENARLASLAAAALWARPHLGAPADDPLQAYAEAALDWLFGRNPFDACMVQGAGHGPAPRYEPRYWNAPGGVCNGITAGLADEDDIDFRAPHETDPMHSWRWTEQWLPHGAWLMLALALATAD